MPVHQHGRQPCLFHAARNQNGQVDTGGVGMHLTGEAQLGQRRNQVLVQVGVLGGRLVRHLAFRGIGDAARQRGFKGAIVEGFNGLEDGLFAVHGGSQHARKQKKAQSYYASVHATIR
ncbi:hypothetical protein D3C71_1646210 [compost metagenome]